MSGPGIHPYHQQWPQPLPVTPSLPPPPIPGEIPGHSSTDEVRTIFISGLPGDVKERELINLLRWLPGFEASQINYKGDQPMGFALFSTSQHAVAAKNALHEMVFDAETQCTIHTEMAKKNLFVKRGAGVDFSSFDQSKRLRTGGDFTHTVYQSPPFHPQPVAVWASPGYMAPPAPYDPFGGYPVPQVAMPTPPPVSTPSVFAPVQNAKDNPPCNTLFVGNLGELVVEEELKGLFSMQPGFKQMKILRQERNTVCFIEFNDVSSATAVHANLQGVVLPTSDRGGIRLHFQKTPSGGEKTQLMALLLKRMEPQQHTSSKMRGAAFLGLVPSLEGYNQIQNQKYLLAMC